MDKSFFEKIRRNAIQESAGQNQYGEDITMNAHGAFLFVKIISEILRRHEKSRIWNSFGNCHIYCDCIARLSTCFEVRDGYYGFLLPAPKKGRIRGGMTHSWLAIKDEPHIIDVRPCGVFGGPIMYVRSENFDAVPALFHTDDTEVARQIEFIRNDSEYSKALELMTDYGAEAVQATFGNRA